MKKNQVEEKKKKVPREWEREKEKKKIESIYLNKC